MCFAIVVCERNGEVTDNLLKGCVETLERFETLPENIHVKRVPGNLELVYGAHQMTRNDGYDAVIALGCVVRGETPNFDYICQGVTYGLSRLNAESNVPVIDGILTTDTMEQALARSGGNLGNKGEQCAIAAIKMAKF